MATTAQNGSGDLVYEAIGLKKDFDGGKVSALRGTLGGGNETMLSSKSIVAADTTNAIAFPRTTDQVLQIVYGAAGKGLSKGGFFPNGLNGTIKATAS